MNIIKIALVLLFLLGLSVQQEQDLGMKRLNDLRNKSLTSPNRIIPFTIKQFKEYALKYPRPYTLVIYFYAKQVPLSDSLYGQFNYTVQLYSSQGAIDAQQHPIFFVRIDFQQSTKDIFKYFGFESAPNLVVSRPHMSVVGSSERQAYLKDFKWRMSSTDGVITTQKMLDFINKRAERNIIYKPTQETIEYVISMFVGIAIAGVIIFKLLKVVWSHWFFWFFASMLIYVVCMSGIVYCVLGDSIKHDLSQNKITFFSGRGGRDQGFYQGCLVSGCISLTGIVLILVAVASQRLRERYSAIIGVLGLVVVFYLIMYIQGVYGVKSWYGPSYQPPQHYISGPLHVDQGNNI